MDEQIDDKGRQNEQEMRRFYLRELRETHKVQQKTIVARTKENKGNVSKYCKKKLIGDIFWKKLREAFVPETVEIDKKIAARPEKNITPELTVVNEPAASYKRILKEVKKENQTLRKAFETEMTSLNDQLNADRTVILESLARLEGKPADHLLKEADQRKREIEKAREKPGKDTSL